MPLYGKIVLYTRPGCHLCEKVEDWLLEAGLQWQAVDITTDPVLFERYQHRIPAIDVNGREVLCAPMTRDDVRCVFSGASCGLC